jgi:hypothetical protein
MKKYNNAKGERIEEYGFEDWKIGISPIDPNKSGNKKLLIADSGEIYFQYLPYDELKKIRAKQRRIYFKSVEGYFNMFCKEYEIKFHKSKDKKRLLKTEIEKLEYIFFPEKRANSPIPVGLNMADFGGYDFIYQQEFVLQNIDFSTIEFNENPMYINSRGRTAAYARAKYLDWLKEKFSQKTDETKRKNQGKKPKEVLPNSFEELFFNPNDAEPCLRILGELEKPAIDAANNFIGKAKGIFPMWLKVLKNHKPEPLIKHFPDRTYTVLLNEKVKGLNLYKDASEFRKFYKRLENNKIELDIKTILSQFSQDGKLGK